MSLFYCSDFWGALQLLDNGAEIYKKGNQRVQEYNNGDMEKLHATIGRLKVENDFLQQASSKLM